MFQTTIVQFISLVMPGYISLSIYQYIFPVRSKEDNHYLIWGTAIGILEVFIISKIFPTFLNYNKLDETKNSELFANLNMFGSLVIIGILFGILAVLAIWMKEKILFKKHKLRKLRKNPGSIWQKINSEHEFSNSWVMVYIEDGSMYKGFIKYYQYNPDKDDQDFLLGKAVRVDENLKEIYTIKGKGLYLRLSNIIKIELI